jgi:hypothetical protein
VAQPGQTVIVAGGTYPGETIKYDSTKLGAAQRVSFQPAAGATVSISGELRIEGQHMSFTSMKIGDFYAGVNNASMPQSQQVTDLVFRDVHVQDFYLSGASNVSIVGGEVGPVTDPTAGAAHITPCYLCTYPANNIVIDGMYFHDVVRDQAGYNAGIHTECLHVWGGVTNLTVRNSRFFNCAIMDLFVENQENAGDVHDVTIENNFFDSPGSHGGSTSSGSYSVLLQPAGRSLKNISVRFNSSLASMIADVANGPISNVNFTGNYGYLPSWQCTSGATYAYNVWTGTTCSSTDKQAPLAFVNPSSGDLHLLAGSAAINAVPVSIGALSLDLDGQARPIGLADDAGADEGF